MDTAPKGLIGTEVTVWSTSGSSGWSDTGTLVSVEEPWICIRKPEGLFYFCIYLVRLIKVPNREPEAAEDDPRSLPIPADEGDPAP